MPAKQFNLASTTWSNRSQGWVYIARLFGALDAAVRRNTGIVALLMLTLVQGLLYIFVFPPWQHYDEPTHFEYAWLIANRGRLPEINEFDLTMRREVAASMIEHNFYWNLPMTNILADHFIEIGISETEHPPTYYLLVSLPLRLVRALDVVSQLYIARLVSLGLFVLTIGVVRATMSELLPARHPLRWAVPLALLLLPPFADIMTAVNNDVGAIFVFSVFVWLAVSIIRRGPTWSQAGLLLVVAVVAAATKNTAGLALLLAPVALTLAVWRQRQWPWRWLMLGGAIAASAVVLSTLTWGDAATWYRDTQGELQTSATRISVPNTPHGLYAIQLEAPPLNTERGLLNPLLQADVHRLQGQQVSFGGWVWASQPTEAAVLGLEYSYINSPSTPLVTEPITLTTTPTFMSWTTRIPSDSAHLHYRLEARQLTADEPQVQIFLDGAILTAGTFSDTTTPQFADASATNGTWNGRPFDNFVRNASGEQAWPRLQGWLDRSLNAYARRSLTPVLSALFDIERTGALLLLDVPSQLLFSFFGNYAWGHVALPTTPWQPIFYGLALLSTLGVFVWLWRRRNSPADQSLAPYVFLAIVGVVVWSNVTIRVLPWLDGISAFAVARYGYPAVLPALLLIVGGWWALWPQRWRFAGLIALLTGSVALNAIALWTAWTFYQSLPN